MSLISKALSLFVILALTMLDSLIELSRMYRQEVDLAGLSQEANPRLDCLEELAH